MEKNTLIIGMPAGSLANAGRGGNLIGLLEASGFKTSGYDTGGPTSFPLVNFLYGWDGRPQEFGSQLGIGELDVAIAGDDWIRERTLELEIEYRTSISLEKVMSLKRGGVTLVGIIDGKLGFSSVSDFLRHITVKKDLIVCVSEMPYLALSWLRNSFRELGLYDRFGNYSVQKYKSPPKIDKGILIYETWGKTESKVKNGGADIGLEITQSGSAIRSYGLSIIDTIMESETGIWINPDIKKNPAKLELLSMFLLNLYGTVNAENKVMLLFNVSNNKVKDVERYLRENNLFGDEPTANSGKEFTEYSIQVECANPKLPLARIRYELARLGAKSIDTIPLTSSIPGLDVLQL